MRYLKIILIFLGNLTLLLLFLAGCDMKSKPEEENANSMELTYEGAVIELKDEYNEWNLTPTFNYETSSYSGERVIYEVIGKKNSFGITGSFPIVSSKDQKIFWFYWGKENIKNQPVKIMAYKKGSEELIKVFSGEFYEGAQINEDEVNMPSNLRFPTAGVWNLLVYINDELSGNIVVEVVAGG
ncbi:hypothetical protein [Halobacillus naozhouensis]|uniref:DUF4871 domain-containing protein n=1 Tax=Halobacillus naozhouensis TaxID=554880 RepID=A0ABY8IWM4_9BACI|nr:hypothetical protein [Halobacillus naozhouensis]WFT74146.1 hypothetical protein P9989_17520 [Halobacillus naozhouensis]